MSSHYPVELKQKAVELVTIQRKSVVQVSLELGVSRPTLYYWLNNQSSGSRTLASEKVSMDPAQEIKGLRAQNEAQMVASKRRTRVLAMARSTSYLMEPPQVISQMKRAREGNLRGEIQTLRNRYGYSLGYRPIHALLIKKAISCSIYLVRKVMKLAGFFRLPKKLRYPKGNYLFEIGNLIKGNFQSKTLHEKWFIDITQKRYLSGTIYLAVMKDAASRMVVGYATG